MNQNTTSILITSSSATARYQKAQELSPIDLKTNNPDVFLFDSDQTIGIDLIKNLRRNLQKKPYKETVKVVFIPNAHLMTLPSQNALLKTLEEPPDNTLIILGATNPAQLLPTIVSRCRLINISSQAPKLNQKQSQELAKILKQIKKANVSQKISLAGNYTRSRDLAKDFCHSLLLYLHQKLYQKPQTPTLHNLKLAQKTISRLDQNVNTHLTLEHLFLNLR